MSDVDIYRVLATFNNLSFADRALIVVEPNQEYHAVYLFRTEGLVRIFDDLDSERYRRREGLNHSINSIGAQIEKATSIDHFLKMRDGLPGMKPVERSTVQQAVIGLRRIPKVYHSHLDELLSEHMGIDVRHWIERPAQPVDSFPMRPLEATKVTSLDFIGRKISLSLS